MVFSVSDLLATHPIFATLNQSERNSLARVAIPRTYQKGELIACYGDVWPYLFIVAEGMVRAVRKSSEGRTLIIATFKPGEVYWGVAFFHEELSMPVNLEANELTRIFLWSRERLIPTLLKNGVVSWELSRLMVNRMLHASEIVDELAFQPVLGRLARLLLDQFEHSGEVPISRNLSINEMAVRIGSTREVVYRMLNQFSDDGLIDMTRAEFNIKNREQLEKLAQLVKG